MADVSHAFAGERPAGPPRDAPRPVGKGNCRTHLCMCGVASLSIRTAKAKGPLLSVCLCSGAARILGPAACYGTPGPATISQLSPGALASLFGIAPFQILVREPVSGTDHLCKRLREAPANIPMSMLGPLTCVFVLRSVLTGPCPSNRHNFMVQFCSPPPVNGWQLLGGHDS